MRTIFGATIQQIQRVTSPHSVVRHLFYLNAAIPHTGDSLMITAVATSQGERPDTGLTFQAADPAPLSSRTNQI
ncbi:hypothetical protein ACTG9Q_13145 [Actinokineospora sp. 24-640]